MITNPASLDEIAAHFDACARGNVKDINDFVTRHPQAIDIKNQDGKTSLHIAVMKDYKAFAETLLSMGADVNVQDNEGWTPLMHGIDKGRFWLVHKLLDKVADIDLRSFDGKHDAFSILREKFSDPTITKEMRESFLDVSWGMQGVGDILSYRRRQEHNVRVAEDVKTFSSGTQEALPVLRLQLKARKP